MMVTDGFTFMTLPSNSTHIQYNDTPPAPFLKALENDSYTKGDAKYSVTELLSPSRAVALIHQSGLPEEPRTPFSMMDSLMGRAVHSILEEYDPHEITEEILYCTILDQKIKGQFDRLVDGVIEDYKTVKLSAFKAKTNDNFLDWSLQLNCYAHILREHGVPVTGLRVHAYIKDWSPIERDRYDDYPHNPWPQVTLDLLPPEEILSWMTSRVQSHLDAEQKLPLCTIEDRWARDETWALKKKGKARAVKLFPTQEAATEWASTQSDFKLLYLEKRPSTSIRCRHYCPAASFCPQWEALRDSENAGPQIIPLNASEHQDIIFDGNMKGYF